MIEMKTVFGQYGHMSNKLPDKYFRLMRHLLSHSKITEVGMYAPEFQTYKRFEDSIQMFVYISLDLGADYFDFYDSFKGWTLASVSVGDKGTQLELWQKVKL